MNSRDLRSPLCWACLGCLLVSTFCVLFVFGFLVWHGQSAITREGWNFFAGTEWYPGESYGAFPMIYGSLVVSVVALVVAFPLALSSALFTAEYLSGSVRAGVKTVMELLAGIPGIVYGLLGVTFLTAWVRDGFGLIDGNTLLTAGLLLAIMILPTLMTLSEDALRAVPGEYRDVALSLGLTRLQALWRVTLPSAVPGIVGAVFLALGRAMGETVAVMLVIGGLDQVPVPWFNVFEPGQNIASKMGREAAESFADPAHWSALTGLGLTLFVLVMGLHGIGSRFLKRRVE